MDEFKKEFCEICPAGDLAWGTEQQDAIWELILKYVGPKEKTNDNVSAVIDYLNLKTGKKFKSTGATTKRHIKARYKEGNKLDDFKKVIDIKCEQWLKDPKMSAYLRPETLFGTKMESYLNETFTPRVDPLESLTRELEDLFNSGNIPEKDRVEIRAGGWPSAPWADDMKAHEIAKKIYNLQNTHGS